MNFQTLNKRVGSKLILGLVAVLITLCPLLWKLGTVEVSDTLAMVVILSVVLTFLVLITLLGSSKTSNPRRAFRDYLIIFACAIGAGVAIYFLID